MPFRTCCVLPWSAGVHQVDQRKHEHPDQVDEVPVQAGGLDVAGLAVVPARTWWRPSLRATTPMTTWSRWRPVSRRRSPRTAPDRPSGCSMDSSPWRTDRTTPASAAPRRSTPRTAVTPSHRMHRAGLCRRPGLRHRRQHGDAAGQQHHRHDDPVENAREKANGRLQLGLPTRR